MTAGAPPATGDFLALLEWIRRQVGLKVSTATLSVSSAVDEVAWARLVEMATRATVSGQQASILAVERYAMDTLAAAGVDLSPVSVPVQPGVLGSGRDVRGMFTATRNVVTARVAAGETFVDALATSSRFLVALAASEPHRIGRDGLLGVGLRDTRFGRYERVAEPGACAFCRMLATRGPVYLTEQSAGSGRRYHAHCRCHVRLVASPDAIAASRDAGAAAWQAEQSAGTAFVPKSQRKSGGGKPMDRTPFRVADPDARAEMLDLYDRAARLAMSGQQAEAEALRVQARAAAARAYDR